ncbi:MAG TPA: TerC family protein [Burkholderiales bacterium]|nr:TerC family protein [Burkholderiales bacterium]
MEWLSDPTVWVGLATLVLLEIVLGIDNLIFLAIVTDKLPPHQRDRARKIGLSLALFMRLGLLASISWVMGLTKPLFAIGPLEISWRDAILIGGGAFLLVKATMEIHDRLEPRPHGHAAPTLHAGFWAVIAQIIVLDAVFSLDSIITAIGMVNELYVMMAAVVIAVIAMMVAARPLSNFVNAHPSLVILCLGFLLMIGLVLVADGFGFHIPKGYLYAAIGFSVLIEAFNQIGVRKRQKLAAAMPRRQRIADSVLRLLGGVPVAAPAGANGDPGALTTADDSEEELFAPVEKQMVRGVLTLANRPVQAIMTPRPEVVWIDTAESKEAVLARIRESTHRQFVVSRGSIDHVAGVARKEDILELCLNEQPFDLMAAVRPPAGVHENTSILDTLDLFKGKSIEMALVFDEYGGLQGIVTQTDLLKAIAGDLPEEESATAKVKELGNGALLLDGAMSIHDAQERLELGSLPGGDFNTVAGFVLSLFGRIPAVGERIDWRDWSFEVADMDGWRVEKVLARRVPSEDKSSLAESTPG